MAERLILGVDTGGTFTDFVLQSDSGLQTFKLPSTPDDPSRSIMQGLSHFFGDDRGTLHVTSTWKNAFGVSDSKSLDKAENY